MRMIPVVQGLGALTIIVTYGLKFAVLHIQAFNFSIAIREFFQDMKHTAFDNGHVNPLEALSNDHNTCDGCLLIFYKTGKTVCVLI
jgi:hypothetical protein